MWTKLRQDVANLPAYRHTLTMGETSHTADGKVQTTPPLQNPQRRQCGNGSRNRQD